MAIIEPMTGRYIHLTVQGIEYRIYYEESGQGIPIICQHAGGSQTLEWRFMLNDPEIISKYRVISADLPYHGKSLPPESEEWWKQEYKLTKSFFIDFQLHVYGLDFQVFHLYPVSRLEKAQLVVLADVTQAGVELGVYFDYPVRTVPHIDWY